MAWWLWMHNFSLYHITKVTAYCFDKELTLQRIIHFKYSCSLRGAQLTALLQNVDDTMTQTDKEITVMGVVLHFKMHFWNSHGNHKDRDKIKVVLSKWEIHQHIITRLMKCTYPRLRLLCLRWMRSWTDQMNLYCHRLGPRSSPSTFRKQNKVQSALSAKTRPTD